MHVYIENMRKKKDGKRERVHEKKRKGQLHLLQIHCMYICVRQTIIRN